ncbi:MAG: M50 family metallopeptidase [Clostridiales bacterium]|jgi:regulator of sigma E protease|nr:M50 family metallopeptidase [Clostridiales bacterium]
MSIIIGILIFSLIVVVHEWGHYIAAVKSGVLVEEFAVGMGPKIFGVKRGDTLYSLRLFPLGGFARMLEEEEGGGNPRAFNNKPVANRVAILAAGAFMNAALAFFVFLALNLCRGAYVPVIAEVMDGSPAREAGLAAGDRIVAVNGSRVNVYSDYQFAAAAAGSAPLKLAVARGGLVRSVTVTPRLIKTEDGREAYKVGFVPAYREGLASKEGGRIGAGEAVADAFFQILFWVKATFVGLCGIVTGAFSVNDIAGPVRIVQTVGSAYNEARVFSAGAVLSSMAGFLGMLSANVGIMNLLPLPALDGGRLVFIFLEVIRRKPVDPSKEGLVHFVGFALLLALAVVVAVNDIRNIAGV